MAEMANSEGRPSTLPDDYSYRFIETKGEWVEFRVKEIKDEVSAKTWVQEYSKKTLTAWRVQRTYPATGKVNVFKIDMRCHHNVDNRVKGMRRSKNTNCQATLKIIIKRIKKQGRKHINMPLKEWPCLIRINSAHNHSIHPTNNVNCSVSSNVEQDAKQLTPNRTSLPINQCTIEDDLMEPNNNYFPCDIEETKQSLNLLVNRLYEGLNKNPNLYVPAIRKMIRNTEKYASNETNLASAIAAFGKSQASFGLRRKVRLKKLPLSIQSNEINKNGYEPSTLVEQDRVVEETPITLTGPLQDHMYCSMVYFN